MKTERRWYRWLLAVPFVWCIGLTPWFNSVGYVWGSVPFVLVWMSFGIPVGSAIIGLVYWLDHRNDALDEV